MISGRISLYTACILLVSATSSFSDDRNDFTDAQSVLEHLGITVVKTEKDLAPGSGAELNYSRFPRQVVLQSSPDSCLRVTSSTMVSNPKQPRDPQKVYSATIEGKSDEFFHLRNTLRVFTEFQWGTGKLVDGNVESPVKVYLLVVDDEQQICHQSGSSPTLRFVFPANSGGIGLGAQLPDTFSSGYAIWIVIGADSEGAPWRLLEFQRMRVTYPASPTTSSKRKSP